MEILALLGLTGETSARKTIFELTKFGIGGALGLLIYVGFFHFMTSLGLWYLTASVVATVVKRIFAFLFQKYITFKNKEKKRMWRQGLSYLFLLLFLMGLNTLSLYVLVDLFLVNQSVAIWIPMLPLGLLSFLLTKVIFRNQ